MFLMLACNSQYPAVNKQDFDIWALHCKFQDRPHVDEAKVNLQREGSIVKNDMTKKIDTAKNEMLRFQFVEVIFRLAELCYQNDIKQDDKSGSKSSTKKKKGGKIYMFQAITKLFKDHIDPADHEIADAADFRDKYLYTYRVNQYLERNENVLKKIHSEYNHAGQFYLDPTEAIYFVQQTAGLSFITERSILNMYGLSKQSTIDFSKTPYFAKEMYFVEFLEFFGRLAFLTFYQEVDAWRNLTLQEKIDGLLAHYCKKLRL